MGPGDEICIDGETTMGAIGIRGAFFDFIDDPWKHPGAEHEAARFTADGLMVVKDGIIKDFGVFTHKAPFHRDVEITHIKERLLLPGFVDGHIHFPQTRVLGAFGEQLLPWLQMWIVPEELKYKDRDYAREGARRFFDNILAAGTTTCQAFTTASPVAPEEFFEEAARRNMRVISGLTGIDRNAPEEFMDTPENFYRDSKALIDRHHRQGRSLYAITPRYALGASRELLAKCEQLKNEHPDCWVNTHISENPSECRGTLDLHSDCHDYLGVYEKYKLVGPKFSGGHGVWLSDSEFRRMAKSGAARGLLPVLEPVPRQRAVPHRPGHRSRTSSENGVWHGRGRRQSLLDAQCARRRLQGRHVQQHVA